MKRSAVLYVELREAEPPSSLVKGMPGLLLDFIDGSSRAHDRRHALCPQPDGELHLGSAYSAWTGWHRAREAGGRFLVRIEDIDIRRCKREFETAILEDLKWLGFNWDGEVRRQSELHDLRQGARPARRARPDLSLPCSRAAIERELAASANAPHGPDGPLYPGTCRHLPVQERRDRIASGQRLFASTLNVRRRKRARIISSTRRRLRPRPAAADGRLRDRAQGYADQLPSCGHG